MENLTAERPLLRTRDQPVSNGIQANIFPFALLIFRGAQFVVMETFLPAPGLFAAREFMAGAATG